MPAGSACRRRAGAGRTSDSGAAAGRSDRGRGGTYRPAAGRAATGPVQMMGTSGVNGSSWGVDRGTMPMLGTPGTIFGTPIT